METNLKVGSNIAIDEIIGAWGGNTTPTRVLNVGVSSLPLQKVFDIPNKESVVILYTKTVMGVTYSDMLFYSASDYKRDNDFQTRNKIDFYENRTSSFAKGVVCVSSRSSASAPAITYKFKVLYSSCGDGKITWYNTAEEFVSKNTSCRQNTVENSNGDTIDKTASTTQVLTCDASGNVEGFDMLSHNDYIIDTSLIAGTDVELNLNATAGFQTDKIYRFNFTAGDIKTFNLSAEGSKGFYLDNAPGGVVITLTPYLESGETSYDWQCDYNYIPESQSTYTKEEIDAKLSSISSLDYIYKEGDNVVIEANSTGNVADFKIKIIPYEDGSRFMIQMFGKSDKEGSYDIVGYYSPYEIIDNGVGLVNGNSLAAYAMPLSYEVIASSQAILTNKRYLVSTDEDVTLTVPSNWYKGDWIEVVGCITNPSHGINVVKANGDYIFGGESSHVIRMWSDGTRIFYTAEGLGNIDL